MTFASPIPRGSIIIQILCSSDDYCVLFCFVFFLVTGLFPVPGTLGNKNLPNEWKQDEQMTRKEWYTEFLGFCELIPSFWKIPFSILTWMEAVIFL